MTGHVVCTGLSASCHNLALAILPSEMFCRGHVLFFLFFYILPQFLPSISLVTADLQSILTCEWTP